MRQRSLSRWLAAWGVALAASATLLGPVAPASADHVACGDVITSDVTLDSDLACGGVGLVAGADGITIDLGGHTVRSLSGVDEGVRVVGRRRVTVRRGIVSDFRFGVVVAQGSGIRLGDATSRLVVIRNGKGIIVAGSSRTEITGVTVAGNAETGIEIFVGSAPSRHNRVVGSEIARNPIGILIFDSERDAVVANAIFENGLGLPGGGAGVRLSQASAVVLGNEIAGNAGFGVHVSDSEGASVTANVVRDTGGIPASGIHLDLSRHCLVLGNLLERNGNGVVLGESDQNQLGGNTASEHQAAGFHLHNSTHNALRLNRAANNVNGFVLTGDTRLDPNTGRTNFETIGNVLARNDAVENQQAGYLVTGTQLTAILRSSATGNGVGAAISGENNQGTRLVNFEAIGNGVGVQVVSARGTGVLSSTLSNNGDGLRVDAAARSTRIEGNVANANADDGIDVDGPEAGLADNRADGNGDLGIEAVPGVTDEGGNTASGNGNPLQCLNVACG
jgi:parallel beta-helix repeat protein